MRGLAGKVVLCTGAGRPGGLGQGILQRFAAEGCRLVLTDLGTPAAGLEQGRIGTNDDMEQVAGSLRAAGAEVLVLACDVRSEAQVGEAVRRTQSRYGSLDVLINNAAVGYMMQPFEAIDAAAWRLVLDVNLTGAFHFMQAAAQAMQAAGRGGRIINIASQAAKSGFRHMAPYVASKHGLVGLTRAAAIDLAPHGITVNAVCPNHVTTALGAQQNEYFSKLRGETVEEYRAGIAARIPLGRVGLVTDTAAACAFLASDDAAYITGEAMNVSGGEEMH
jgi:NAD(P)-dependent dehydrogenase (short-subunit alcohol dehydrogenase family)